MLSYIRRHVRFVNVVAVFVLVFAMAGGALAAKKYLITSTKQISPKVLAQLKGAKGANGANGANGAAGPQGPAGPAGTAGAKGDNGASGTNGTPGPKGVTGTNGINGTNGAAGPTGPTGQTGFTKTLPSGETEMGTWNTTTNIVPEEGETWTAISFAIPLEKSSNQAFFINKEETEELDEKLKPTGKGGCAGTLVHPTAPKGELCVYTESEILIEAVLDGGNPLGRAEEGPPGYQSAGAYLNFQVKKGGSVKAWGNWAVTAP